MESGILKVTFLKSSYLSSSDIFVDIALLICCSKNIKVHMIRNFLPSIYGSLESTLKMMKNGLNNLFTAHLHGS
jgi:hypothetical protein